MKLTSGGNALPKAMRRPPLLRGVGAHNNGFVTWPGRSHTLAGALHFRDSDQIDTQTTFGLNRRCEQSSLGAFRNRSKRRRRRRAIADRYSERK